MKSDAERILEFWKTYGYYDYPDDKLLDVIKAHLAYNTCEVIESGDKIIGLVRYNVNGHTASIEDCVIRPEYRKKRVLKLMIIRGWRKFPYVKEITYKRGNRGDERWKKFLIERVLGFKHGKQ